MSPTETMRHRIAELKDDLEDAREDRNALYAILQAAVADRGGCWPELAWIAPARALLARIPAPAQVQV